MYSAPTEAVCFCHLLDTGTAAWIVEFSKMPHNLISELCTAMPLPFSNAFGVGAAPMKLPRCLPAFQGGISLIVPSCSEPEVPRIDTGSDITTVTDAQTIGDIAMRYNPCVAMSTIFPASNIELSITTGENDASPQPASISALDSFPKGILRDGVHSASIIPRMPVMA